MSTPKTRIQRILEVPASTIGQDKEIKCIRIEKEETNCHYLQMV